ncbi:unnamed protein product [Peronospora belbahrii]|uniref:Uncharacterized protein n=1 Tax=Peronospora belbahrii TaxID=622444 RepID=A0AAU9L7U7_9STRA|nr:unnamed protein product [Peronospora belbahrii]CAH0522431.1 unnamed protein product [Peronospora belbahrii]
MTLCQTLRKTAHSGVNVASRSLMRYSTERMFPNFSVYGSDSVFQVSPNAPQYTSSGTYLKTKRMGAIMLSWAKATNSGYNYQNKTFFSLSPSEVGLVLELLDSRIPELSLTHSPNMNAPEEDKNTKTLHIARTVGSDGNSLIMVKVNHDGESVSMLNVGETRVLRELLTYSLPRLLGFHSVLEGPLNIDGGSGSEYLRESGNSYSSGSAVKDNLQYHLKLLECAREFSSRLLSQPLRL